MADLGTDNFDQEFTLGLLENEEKQLQEIAAALQRIELGSFGTCEECHKPILKARLDALPFARHCVDCARKVQQSE
jgi:RNA polymerase-binding transcription factor DksA